MTVRSVFHFHTRLAHGHTKHDDSRTQSRHTTLRRHEASVTWIIVVISCSSATIYMYSNLLSNRFLGRLQIVCKGGNRFPTTLTDTRKMIPEQYKVVPIQAKKNLKYTLHTIEISSRSDEVGWDLPLRRLLISLLWFYLAILSSIHNERKQRESNEILFHSHETAS